MMVSLVSTLIMARTEVATVEEDRIATRPRLCCRQSIEDGGRLRGSNFISDMALATADGKTPSGWDDCGKCCLHVSPDVTILWTMTRILGRKCNLIASN